MTASCSNCKFWTHWRWFPAGVERGDPFGPLSAIGHCVVHIPIYDNIDTAHVQGLTGEDFYCPRHKERGANE